MSSALGICFSFLLRVALVASYTIISDGQAGDPSSAGFATIRAAGKKYPPALLLSEPAMDRENLVAEFRNHGEV
jgi:hypothetical protein